LVVLFVRGTGRTTLYGRSLLQRPFCSSLERDPLQDNKKKIAIVREWHPSKNEHVRVFGPAMVPKPDVQRDGFFRFLDTFTGTSVNLNYHIYCIGI
jgi:hypothetical protein